MLSNDTRKKLENIIRGISLAGEQDNCATIRNVLCASFSTSRTVKKDFDRQSIIKEKQAELLKTYCTNNHLWILDLPDKSRFLAKGGEAQVYLDKDNRSVVKLNDAIYYATWLEFFNSLVIHNLLFKDTAYTFLGFTQKNGILQAVLKQPYIHSDGIVNLSDVKELLHFNGFEKTKRNDYYNQELGLILEDMHDENVIMNVGTLFFIDTVFYTVSEIASP